MLAVKSVVYKFFCGWKYMDMHRLDWIKVASTTHVDGGHFSGSSSVHPWFGTFFSRFEVHLENTIIYGIGSTGSYLES